MQHHYQVKKKALFIRRPNSDPERWEKAQRIDDDRFQARFGTELFNEQQALAVNHK
jgi:hypothetical protein